jgi:glycosyltransferase involved in cell wall biosynthesis
MKILLVSHGWPLNEYGGVGLYVKSLVDSFHSLGHTLTLLTPGVERSSAQLSKTTYPWGEHWAMDGPPPKNWLETWRQTTAGQILKSELSRHHQDVIHIHHIGGLPLDFWSLIPQHSVRVLSLHDYAIPCMRGQLLNAEFLECTGPEINKCVECIGHQLRTHPILRKVSQRVGSTILKSQTQQLLKPKKIHAHHKGYVQSRLTKARKILQEADYCFSPSKHLQDQFSKMAWTVPTQLELPLLSKIRPAPPLKTSVKKLFFNGSIIPAKGLHLLLEALSLLSPDDISLTVSGEMSGVDGWLDYPTFISNKIQHLKSLGYQIQNLGHIPHARVEELLHQHHIFILPSLWPENSPISIREAAAAGLTVICRKSSGATELCPAPIAIDPTKQSIADAIQMASMERQQNQSYLSPLEHAEILLEYYTRAAR